MDKSMFDKIVEMFEIAKPSIERGIDSMQSRDQEKAKKIWQELAEMIEARDSDIEKFSVKLKELSQQVYEYRIRSYMLSSKMDIV